MYHINVPKEIELNPPSPVIIIFYYGFIKGYCYTSAEYPIMQIKALFTNESIFHALALKPECKMNSTLKRVIV